MVTAQGPESAAIALGCMGMSALYGPLDRDESIATIHAALELEEAIGAVELELTGEDLAAIEKAVPADAAGSRYPEQQMAMLDSER